MGLKKQIFELLDNRINLQLVINISHKAVFIWNISYSSEFYGIDSWRFLNLTMGLWYYTASEKMSRQVQLIFTQYGIVTSNLKHGS